ATQSGGCWCSGWRNWLKKLVICTKQPQRKWSGTATLRRNGSRQPAWAARTLQFSSAVALADANLPITYPHSGRVTGEKRDWHAYSSHWFRICRPGGGGLFC